VDVLEKLAFLIMNERPLVAAPVIDHAGKDFQLGGNDL
jgi:hypothetical protein